MSRIPLTMPQVSSLYKRPLFDLIREASEIHKAHHDPNEIQVNSLISIKTGGCPEDCAYCPQAARYQTDLEGHSLMTVETVMEKALTAREQGASRVCLGAAWRQVKNNKDFDQVLDMVKKVSLTGMEVCCTLGMLNEEQAQRLKEAGLYAYNHNLDTSENYYDEIITTRTFDDRLKTLSNVRKSNISVCTGGIIGMGESEEDRISLLHTLVNMDPPPESVPINALVPVKGTPLAEQEKVSIWEMVRMIATARILMPQTYIRLSAGRNEMSLQDQALCFLAGANSIFTGEKLLTTPNPLFERDKEMFELFGLRPKVAEKAPESLVC